MTKEEQLHEITKELVKQMTGLDVTDPQEGDYQIAYYYLNKAIDYMSSCTELKCDREKQAYEKGWEDGAKVASNDVSSRM